MRERDEGRRRKEGREKKNVKITEKKMTKEIDKPEGTKKMKRINDTKAKKTKENK